MWWKRNYLTSKSKIRLDLLHSNWSSRFAAIESITSSCLPNNIMPFEINPAQKTTQSPNLFSWPLFHFHYSVHLSNQKNPGCTGYIGDYTTSTHFLGDYFIHHFSGSIPSKQPGFDGCRAGFCDRGSFGHFSLKQKNAKNNLKARGGLGLWPQKSLYRLQWFLGFFDRVGRGWVGWVGWLGSFPSMVSNIVYFTPTWGMI